MQTIYDNMYVYRDRQPLRNIMKENILKKVSEKNGFSSYSYREMTRLFMRYDFSFTELLNILQSFSSECSHITDEPDPGYTEEIEETA